MFKAGRCHRTIWKQRTGMGGPPKRAIKAPPAHWHPDADEHFEVLAGKAAFTIEGAERVLGAGETVEVPAGTRHTFRNAGGDEMRVVFEFRPAPASTERFYELYFGFAQPRFISAITRSPSS